MKVSARNVVKGTIMEVVRGQMTASVRIDAGGVIFTSSITSEAADELGLKPGMSALAVIKASDVIIAVDEGLSDYGDAEAR
jgi:molybdopterin-binding protein